MESSMSCGQMIKFSLSKLIGEFIGTMFLTMFFTSHSPAVIFGGLFMMNVFVWKLSGSHFNPAITLAFVIRRTEKMPVGLGIAYMTVQIIGAYLGALLVAFYELDLLTLEYNDPFIMRALCQELFSTFVYITFFLSVTDVKMRFSKDNTINCFILASAYVGARAVFFGQAWGVKPATTTYGAVMNPAMALGIAFSGFLDDGWDSWKAIYLYPTIPFGGAVLAVLFYEFVYKKTIQALSHLA